MASPVTRRPTVESRPRPSTTYISFDNSSQLKDFRLDRTRRAAEKRQSQQARTYKQLVRALSSVLETQMKTTTKKSPSGKSRSQTTRSKHS
jgi:3-phenylpropionate/cinnamic acid dioxygenase small subunit